MLLIVYVGAIIILIGYVCAVCPNIKFSNSNIVLPVTLLAPTLILLSPSQYLTPTIFSNSFNFFFTPLGLPVFFVVVLMLFIILLVVTSYYVSPNGPFRSVS